MPTSWTEWNQNKNISTLVEAINENRPNTVRSLLLRGFPADSKDEFDQTPLTVAVKKGYKEIVELLLKHNADVDVKDEYGVSPLAIALGGCPRILKSGDKSTKRA